MLAPGHIVGDEVWQLSKDSADAATACSLLLLIEFSIPYFVRVIYPARKGWETVGEMNCVRRKRESKKRNQNRNRGSLITVSKVHTLLLLCICPANSRIEEWNESCVKPRGKCAQLNPPRAGNTVSAVNCRRKREQNNACSDSGKLR